MPVFRVLPEAYGNESDLDEEGRDVVCDTERKGGNLKAITVCQPYAAQMFLPMSHLMRKRCENRTWATKFRGPILIHAGKSERFLADGDPERYQGMEFGALIGCVEIIDDVALIGGASGRVPDDAARKYPWLRRSVHTAGPHCFILADEVRRFREPIPFSGKLDIWNIDAAKFGDEMLDRIARAIVDAEVL